MILIDKIEEVNTDEGAVTVSVVISGDKIGFDKTLGGMDAAFGIEFMAQTIACCAYFKSGGREPKIGFLLGTRSYKCNIEKFALNKTYTVKAYELYSDGELVSYECFIYNDGMEAASAVINAYQPENAENFF